MAIEQRAESQQESVTNLKDAVREARIEAAERSGVVVDLRDAELARLELLNEELDPLFKEIPSTVELFDRGISQGDVPRLWIDVVAHVEMGRDKRLYRFVQDTRYGRKVLAEDYEAGKIAQAVTRYVARRMVERERALGTEIADDRAVGMATSDAEVVSTRGQRWPGILTLLTGLVFAAGMLILLTKLNAH